MTTKADRKRAESAISAFHNYYGSDKNWGHDRWTASLYPALCLAKVHATLPNAFLISAPAEEGVSSGITSSNQLWSPLDFTITAKPATPTVHPDPSLPSASLLSHYTLDPASLIPVALLAPSGGEHIGDLCAAPGGKSFAIAQLLFNHCMTTPPKWNPEIPSRTRDISVTAQDRKDMSSGHKIRPPYSVLHVNEPDRARLARLDGVLRNLIPAALMRPSPGGAVTETLLDATDAKALSHVDRWDKVLVDAPCSSERHVITAHVAATAAGKGAGKDMLAFRSGGAKGIIKTQVALLLNALEHVKAGGRVVYSTCSIDRAENEGVVTTVLEKLGKGNHGLGLVLRDPLDMIPALEDICERGRDGIGAICLPDRGNRGWGPIYFCVLEKT